MTTAQERYRQWRAEQGSQAIIREHRGDDTEMWEAAYTQGWKDAIEAAAAKAEGTHGFPLVSLRIAAEIRRLAE